LIVMPFDNVAPEAIRPSASAGVMGLISLTGETGRPRGLHP
jgi:hypothetical protein